ncbi:type II toxin-antitoxin system HicA family toxin [Laspinema olomoucense]|uniref:type II toxin-antitoxin system HicA family toxin n=1 Tax=Laspinema olomoucense TaxID=3231600 RepID=UPI0021BB6B76|nr:type II toxin-antitoxin system HicA family toxin [Laspinema sp. D3d]MCT7971452.1 type II toxin-antitoxin system HicA family toxin [Laspinema sp. D3d]
MPKKIRELKRLLRKAGFSSISGKGSHTKWYHPRLPLPIILSGNNGDDAKPYQERDVNDALKIIEEEIE